MEFSEWLATELHDKRMTQVELARKSGISQGAVAHILAGRRKPEGETCRRIAQALKVPPEDVLRIAGILPPKSPHDQQIERIYYKLSLLDETDRKQAEKYLDFLVEETDRGKTTKGGKE